MNCARSSAFILPNADLGSSRSNRPILKPMRKREDMEHAFNFSRLRGALSGVAVSTGDCISVSSARISVVYFGETARIRR